MIYYSKIKKWGGGRGRRGNCGQYVKINEKKCYLNKIKFKKTNKEAEVS